MDWRFLVTILVAVSLGIAVIVLALRVTRKRQPVWAYRTTKIIGLGSDAPSDLELTFNEQVVSDVYRTRFIFFNRGNEAILKDNVTESVAIQFKGAEILRQPDIKAKSKEAIEFSARQVVKGGYNCVEVDFLYLDRDDGGVVDVLHTASEKISCTGNIIGSREIKNIGEFEPAAARRQRERVIVSSVLVAAFLGLVLYQFLTSRREPWEEPGVTLFAFVLSIAMLVISLCKPFSYFRQRRFPGWGAAKD
jgi:hypothetical protein